ncbi:MAG: endonuclease/exonuclease/phosphatase family protein [Phycisphaerae bacterium]|nr:endonuclease/exonuclease/phosphatase family protein [Phycisphaerae bacterium]
MTDTHDSTGRSAPGGPPGVGRRTGGSHRRRNLAILVLALCLGLYAAYAGRRTPVEPQQGAAVSWPNGSQPIAKTQLRVATYNIHRGKGTDGVRDLDRTAAILRDADLIGLNEVAGPAFWGRADQVEQLADKLKIGWQFAPNQYRWHKYHFGNGLLCRLPVGPWTSEPLVYDRARSNSHRNLLTAQVTAGGQLITFMVTHLDRGEIRPVQLKHVLDEFAEHTPAVLVGDFNTTAADPLLVAFFADGNNVDAIAQTFGASDDKGRIDWIITRGMRVLTGGMEPAGVSDHPCYWVNLEAPGPARP